MKRQITRSYLEYLGITEVTRDGRVFTKNGERKPREIGHGDRLAIQFRDSQKYKSVSKEERTTHSGDVTIYLYHIVFAWFNIEIPYGKEIHHIDGNYRNNAIDNLEALTHAEHVAKHAKTKELTSTREEKCRLDIPRSWYEEKLEQYIKEGKASAACHTRARLRYYDNHIVEAQKLNEFNKDCMELAAWKATFKENNNKKLWHECCEIEKMVKEQNLEAWPIVKHALEVAHKYFGRREENEAI